MPTPERSLAPPDVQPMSDADANRLQERMEDLARDEVEDGALVFYEWLVDDPVQMINVIVCLNIGTDAMCDMAKCEAEKIAATYIQYRTNDPRFIDQVQQEMADEQGDDA